MRFVDSVDYYEVFAEVHRLDSSGFARLDCNLDDVVATVFEQVVCLFNLGEWICVGYQGSGVNLSLGYKPHNLVTVATVHAAGLERQVFAIHIRQR